MEEWFVGLLFGIGGTIVASGVTLLISTRDLGLRRRTDTIDRFLRTASVAHGYPVDERSGTVGTGEQIAAIFLVADLARRDKWLRLSGLAFLEELSTWLEHSEGDAATRLLSATRRARDLAVPWWARGQIRRSLASRNAWLPDENIVA